MIMLLYFESCESVWGGSPATSAIHGGIESADIMDELETSSSSPATVNPASSTSLESDECEGGIYQSPQENPNVVDELSVNTRCALLNSKLRNHKTDKLKRKISVDAQLLNLAIQEMEIKKGCLTKWIRWRKKSHKVWEANHKHGETY